MVVVAQDSTSSGQAVPAVEADLRAALDMQRASDTGINRLSLRKALTREQPLCLLMSKSSCSLCNRTLQNCGSVEKGHQTSIGGKKRGTKAGAQRA